MIDTDKYEGHTPAPWNIRDDIMILGGHRGFDYIAQVGFEEDYNDIPEIRKNAQLIADAPLLLAEVKRLREQYTELREALIGDSPNWTHEELIEFTIKTLEIALDSIGDD